MGRRDGGTKGPYEALLSISLSLSPHLVLINHMPKRIFRPDQSVPGGSVISQLEFIAYQIQGIVDHELESLIQQGSDYSLEALYLKVEVPLRSEEHTSELQSRENLVCRLLLG